MRKPTKSGLFWNRLPQILNLAWYRMLSLQGNHVLDYEPLHLYVNPLEATLSFGAERSVERPAQFTRLDKDSFRFLLDQVPTIRTIEFSCQDSDPLAAPDIFALVDYAYRFNGSKSTIISEGWHLASRLSDILASRLSTLVIPLGAHRPSQYSRMTGRPLQHFVTLKSMIEELVQRKKVEGHALEVELVMQVDVHNYLEIPQMVQFAKNLGVDGIRFENFHSPELDPKEERTIFSAYRSIVRYLEGLAETVLPEINISVTLPRPLERDMSQHRNCMDAYTTVSIDMSLNVSGCSRQALHYDPIGKVWDEDLFNNPMYQWMRSVHCRQANPAAPLTEVPLACQRCSRNLPKI